MNKKRRAHFGIDEPDTLCIGHRTRRCGNTVRYPHTLCDLCWPFRSEIPPLPRAESGEQQMFETYDEESASPTDRAAWILCQIVDDDAPIRWTRWRGYASCMANSDELLAAFKAMRESGEQ